MSFTFAGITITDFHIITFIIIFFLGFTIWRIARSISRIIRKKKKVRKWLREMPDDEREWLMNEYRAFAKYREYWEKYAPKHTLSEEDKEEQKRWKEKEWEEEIERQDEEAYLEDEIMPSFWDNIF